MVQRQRRYEMKRTTPLFFIFILLPLTISVLPFDDLQALTDALLVIHNGEIVRKPLTNEW